MLELIKESDLDTVPPFLPCLSWNRVLRVDGHLSRGAGATVGFF